MRPKKRERIRLAGHSIVFAGLAQFIMIFDGGLLAGHANAFEHNGFQSGMSIDAAKANARKYGLKLVDAEIEVASYTLMSKDGPRGLVQFCKGKLFQLSNQLAGKVDSMSSTAEKLIANLGQPVVDARSGYNDSGQVSFLTLTWSSDTGDEQSLHLSSLQGHISLSQSFSAFKATCR